MDVQSFEQRREQANFTDALRSVRQEVQSLSASSDREKQQKSVRDFGNAVKEKGLDPSKIETMISERPAGTISTDQSMRAKAGRAADSLYEGGQQVNEVLSKGVSTAGSILGLDQQSADFAGDVLGYQAPENHLDSGLMALPLIGGALKGAKKGAKALDKIGQAAGGVQHGTAPMAPTIKTEQDLKKVVDAPAGVGRTFVILTDEKPFHPTQEGYQTGSLEQLIRKAGPYESYRVTGKYKGGDENSFMLVSSKPNDQELITKALRWAKAAGQQSIGTNEGILYTDGKLNPKIGPAVYGEEAKLIEDGHSILNIESDGQLIPFSMPIDWNKSVPSSYKHDYTGIGFSNQRFLNVPSNQYFLGEVPKGLNYKQVARYQNELKVPGTSVYDFNDNPLNLPQQGYEEILKRNGYRAAITYGQDGLPSLHTLDAQPVSRVIDRSRPFDGPDQVATMGAPKVVFPEQVPQWIVAGLSEGKIDPTGRKELVQMGAAMLAQPEMSSAKPRLGNVNEVLHSFDTGFPSGPTSGKEHVDNKFNDIESAMAWLRKRMPDPVEAYGYSNEQNYVALANDLYRESQGIALAKGEKKQFSTRLGRDFKFKGADNLTHENMQDVLAYMSAKDESADPAVRQGWVNLIKQIEARFDELVGKGLKVEYVDGQPYGSLEEMAADFKKTGVLRISKDFNEHPIFTPDQNLKFRAVHDLDQHIEPGHEFDMKGEQGAFNSGKGSIQGEDAQNALRVEVLGQASSMLASGGKFPKQKIFDLKKQREQLGLVEGASADLFNSWVKSFEERLPQEAKGKLDLEQYRELFNDSVKAYTKHLKTTEGQIPNTKTLLALMNDSHGRSIQEWYSGARPELERHFGQDADLMAKFIALFSPQADVKTNVARAFDAYRAYKLGERDPHAIMRAAGINKPEDFVTVSHNLTRVLRSPDEQLAGRKVMNFLSAINGDKNAVVIDKHMAGVFGFNKVEDEGVYSFIEDHIRMLAAETGVPPADAQAILWGSWKATKGQAAELKNLDEFIKDFAKQNPDLLMQGHNLDEAGVTRLQASWMLAKIMAGGGTGATIGDNPEDRLKNALVGAGLGFLASKPVIQKIAQAMRENAPAKWFGKSGEAPAPTVERTMTPEEAVKAADQEAAQKARLNALRNKPQTVTVGEQTYELDMKALDTPEQVKQAVDEMARVYKKQLDAGTLTPGSRGTIPNALAQRLGQHLGLTEQDVLNRTRGSVGAVEHVFAYADIMDAAKTRAMQSLEFYNSGVKSFEKELLEDIDRYVQVGYQLDGLLEELGRGLQAAGHPNVSGLTQGFRGFVGPFEMLKTHGALNGDSVAAMVKEVGLEGAAGIGKAVQKAGLWDMVAEVTYGFTLSNPRSNIVNVASSSVVNPILSIMTRNIAETVGSGAVIDGEARAMLFGYFSGVQRMARAVAQTYREGGAINLMRSIRDVKPVAGSADKSGVGKAAITGENVSALMPRPFQFDPNGWLGKLVDGAGAAIRTPSLLMELGDHFSYAVNYDMAMHARAFREGVKLGKDGKDLEAFIAKEILNPSPEIKREAEQFAQHEIFKSIIDGHGGKIVDGLNHPALRPFITFVKAPVNIFRYNLEGVPLMNRALKSVRADMEAGGARRDLAQAKMMLGGTMAALAGMLASQDVITGNGPDNPKLRNLWLIDHQPYSIRLPGMNEWASYRYFDPVASWFGMAADATHFMAFDKDELTYGEWAMSIVLGFMRNFTDKTYTRDTFEFLDQLTVRPGENAETALDSLKRYMDKKVTTYVPFSSLSRAVRNAVDPYVREAFTLQEKIKNSIPGWSKDLPERLDFFGDPIVNPRFNSFLPFPLKDNTGDDVIDELIRIRANVGMPSKVFDGEDLTSQEYHDLVEARGKKIKQYTGKDLRETLIDVFNSEVYRSNQTTDAARKLMVESTVEGINQAAYAIMADPSGANNPRFVKHLQAQKKAEALTGQKLNLNFGAQ